MRTIYRLYILIFPVVLMSACGKGYLDIKPKGKVIPSSYNDYRLLLNNAYDLPESYGLDEFATDNVEFYEEKGLSFLGTSIYRLHTWQKDAYIGTNINQDWAALYKQIYLANVVLDGMLTVTDGAVDARKQLMGEALVHRSFAYFSLVNLYGKQFDSTTSATDAGVPLLLEPSINGKLNRASVKAVYDQLIEDLIKAIPLLETKSTSLYEPTRIAAHAVLARAYLQIGNYAAAGEQANSALQLNNKLTDYNNFASNSSGFPRNRENSETILVKIVPNAFDTYSISKDLAGVFKDSVIDLRYQLMFSSTSPAFEGYLYYDGENLSSDTRAVGPTVPEMLLIRAEAAARQNKKDEAMNDINTLRIARIESSKYIPLTAASSEEALEKVLEERRRELCFKGLRLFDLKRLNKDLRFAKTITRSYDGQQFELKPNDYRYLFPIAPQLISLNPELEPNERK